MNGCRKFGSKQNYVPFSLISWHLSWQIMLGGFCFVFFRPGGRSFALKNCPGAGILTEKVSGPGVSPGGMVTGQAKQEFSPKGRG